MCWLWLSNCTTMSILTRLFTWLTFFFPTQCLLSPYFPDVLWRFRWHLHVTFDFTSFLQPDELLLDDGGRWARVKRNKLFAQNLINFPLELTHAATQGLYLYLLVVETFSRVEVINKFAVYAVIGYGNFQFDHHIKVSFSFESQDHEIWLQKFERNFSNFQSLILGNGSKVSWEKRLCHHGRYQICLSYLHVVKFKWKLKYDLNK